MPESVVLSRYAIGPVMRVEPLGGAGGFSGAAFWRVQTAEGRFCLRRWPKEHPSVEELRRIHQALEHISTKGITTIPVPRRTSGGKTIVFCDGHLWQLEPWMPGKADFRERPSHRLLEGLLYQLAIIHESLVDFESIGGESPSPGLRSRLMQAQAMQGGQLEELRRAVERGDRGPKRLREPIAEVLSLMPAVLPVMRRELEIAAKTPVPLQFCLRDIWHDHVLFSGDKVSGIIDFGSMGVETVAADLARLLGSMAGDNAALWQAGLEAYSRHRPLSPAEAGLIPVFDRSAVVLSGVNWARWLFGEGRVFADLDAVSQRLDEILRRLRLLADRPDAPHPSRQDFRQPQNPLVPL